MGDKKKEEKVEKVAETLEHLGWREICSARKENVLIGSTGKFFAAPRELLSSRVKGKRKTP